MRRFLAALLVIGTFAIVTAVSAGNRVELEPYVYDYIVHNFEEDTGSKNAVAAILLSYRMYDTMFEALILLAAIVGMTQFLPRPGDMTGGPRSSATQESEDTTDE
ncbi:MAG: hypothetical protein EA382_02820 [Spirochaetaceae bacterium]|nr:MAG: hypothetical protein EA382_02820 [Spirochaetaceae bacterium]